MVAQQRDRLAFTTMADADKIQYIEQLQMQLQQLKSERVAIIHRDDTILRGMSADQAYQLVFAELQTAKQHHQSAMAEIVHLRNLLAMYSQTKALADAEKAMIKASSQPSPSTAGPSVHTKSVVQSPAHHFAPISQTSRRASEGFNFDNPVMGRATESGRRQSMPAAVQGKPISTAQPGFFSATSAMPGPTSTAPNQLQPQVQTTQPSALRTIDSDVNRVFSISSAPTSVPQLSSAPVPIGPESTHPPRSSSVVSVPKSNPSHEEGSPVVLVPQPFQQRFTTLDGALGEPTQGGASDAAESGASKKRKLDPEFDEPSQTTISNTPQADVSPPDPVKTEAAAEEEHALQQVDMIIEDALVDNGAAVDEPDSIEDSVAAIFEDEDPTTGLRECRLCNMRHEMGLMDEEKPTFLRSTLDQLVDHCIREHEQVWKTLRNGAEPA
ncbi:hypothetical protein PUNSTDRAFT_142527 [Punctularia strigosozonata HHB-11173 SS5]|uniref:uncharacterized protein n=1 Tax=Punctularia strigosozonata (strain HHB-11173) TaxID=741275 RepID=UPI0004417A97|nr:uncharacterized protein PUNSTDRAFT_142527 [Punctularia strigosozonata HHB-11173 SS5]EIN10532.1 hypothetical protein PUNSTDRAFT_142527 [Punctularia strigosozonata HHB-11173 SS5]